jgi:hypothetical protein
VLQRERERERERRQWMEAEWKKWSDKVTGKEFDILRRMVSAIDKKSKE